MAHEVTRKIRNHTATVKETKTRYYVTFTNGYYAGQQTFFSKSSLKSHNPKRIMRSAIHRFRDA